MTLDDFMGNVDMAATGTGCWFWRGYVSPIGYGQIVRNRCTAMAHRLSYELHGGVIPEKYTIDHLCRTRSCVNPSHLEPVTNIENVMRGLSYAAQNARKTHCIHGHPLSGANLRWKKKKDGRPERACRSCHRIYDKLRRGQK